MGIATTQQLNKYYDVYRDTEVTFTKDIIRALNLDPRQVCVKTKDGQWSCIINSTSFMRAKIIVSTKSPAIKALADKENPNAQVKFFFNLSSGEHTTFFVSTRVEKISPYANSQEMAIVTLLFTQRPPDDLIEIMGRLLEANSNAVRRREERVAINDDSKRKIGITKEETILTIQNVPRHCILRDVSFSGAKVVLVGLSQFLMNKDAILNIEFDEPQETVQIRGTIVSADALEGKKNISTASIKFDENIMPLSYKLHLNDYFTSVRKVQLSATEQIEQQKAAAAQNQ